jgi:hypothetical protein
MNNVEVLDGWMDFGGWRQSSCTRASIWAYCATRWENKETVEGIRRSELEVLDLEKRRGEVIRDLNQTFCLMKRTSKLQKLVSLNIPMHLL